MRFAPEVGLDLNAYPNKDASVFPESVVDPHGRPALPLMIDVYYGMADARIGVARLTLPTTLPGASGAESVSWS